MESSDTIIRPGSLIKLKSDEPKESRLFAANSDDFVNSTIGCISIFGTLNIPDFISNQFLLDHADLARLPIGAIGLVLKKTESYDIQVKEEYYNEIVEETERNIKNNYRKNTRGINLDKSKYPYLVYDWYAVYFDTNQFLHSKNEFNKLLGVAVDWAARMRTGIYLCFKSNFELCQ